MKLTTTLLALWLSAAGAQASFSPEELLDRYTATGDAAILDECRATVEMLPRTQRSRLLRARLALASGDASRAYLEASELNREIPDELETYALMADAALVRGNVEKAEKAAQWMLNLRPEDFRSLLRGAAVREAIGDPDGAAEMLNQALARTSRADTYVRAAIGTALARTNIALGRKEAALRLLDQVETLAPGYRPAGVVRQRLEETK
jgi:tetratricopeptide (TPR) repeat protein